MSTPRELLQRLAGYVPFHALVAVLDQPDREFGPLERRDGAVLRVELDGLTPMADALSSRGRQGADELARVQSLVLSDLLERALFPCDGYLLRFGGETLTAFFDGREASARAAFCALQMVQRARAFSALQTSAGVRSVRLRAGVASGPFSLVYLGAGHDRVACVPGGGAVQRALELTRATAWGTAAADDTTFSIVNTAGRGGPVKHGAVLSSAQPIDPVPLRDLVPRLATASDSTLERLLPLVPESLAQAAQSASGVLAPEIRRATVLVARIAAADWDGARAPADARAAGETFRNAVLAVRRAGGRVGPVEAALDGFRLMATFSAPQGRGDAERAAQCALDLRGLGLAVALEQGSTFTGEVGSGLKRELAVIGEGQDLASRLLSLARVGDAIVGPYLKAQLWGFGIEALPEVVIEEKSSAAAPGLLLAAPEPDALRARPRAGESTTVPSGPGGRERELERLRDRGARVRASGSAGAAVIRGEVGVGKSTVLDAFATEWGAQGGSVASVRLTFADSERPWALAGRLMRQLLRLPSDFDPLKAPDAVSRFDRRLSTVAPYAAVLLGAPGQATPESVAELLRGLLAHRASDAPLLIALDNAHHADASSAQVWARIAHDLSARPLFWVLSHSGVAPVLVDALAPDQLEVAPLDASLLREVGARLVTGLSEEQLTQAVALGQGNLFKFQAAARWLQSRGKVPEGAALDAGWTLGLGEDPETMAHLVAAFGGARASVEVLHEALREFDRRANGRDAIAALEKRELLERRLGKVRFRSPAVQEAIYSRLPPERLQRLHGAIGRALKLCEPESQLAVFAFHFSRSDSPPEAVRMCMRAGEEALRAGALAEASELFGRAARAAEKGKLPEFADALARQARTQVRLGRIAEVRALVERAVEVARRDGRHRGLSEALIAGAQAAAAHDDWDRAIATAQEAAEAVAWAKDPDLAAEVFAVAGALLGHAGAWRLAARFGRQGLRSSRRQGAPVLAARARLALGLAAQAGGHLRGAVREFAEAERLFSIAGEPGRASEAAALRALALAQKGESRAAITAARQVLDVLDVRGTVRATAQLATGLALLELKQSREAELAFSQARLDSPRRIAGQGEILELLSRALRSAAGAQEALDGLVRLHEGTPSLRAVACLAVAMASGERGDVLREVEALGQAETLIAEHARVWRAWLRRLQLRASQRGMAQA